MHSQPAMVLLGLLVAISAGLAVYCLIRGEGLRFERGGRMLCIVALVAVPALVAAASLDHALRTSKERTFCLSCHEMEPYGESLMVDDDEPLAAVHFQNRYVPRDSACYVCHTDYSMFGDLKAKINGLRHVAVHYFGDPVTRIALYKPYSNRNCLWCHEGARKYVEQKKHRQGEATLAALRAGAVSCLQCHEVAHDIGGLDETERWSPEP